MPFGRKTSTLADRIQYMREHKELWLTTPLNEMKDKRFVCRKHEDHVRIGKALKAAGLYAPTTYVMDIQVGELIRLSRE